MHRPGPNRLINSYQTQQINNSRPTVFTKNPLLSANPAFMTNQKQITQAMQKVQQEEKMRRLVKTNDTAQKNDQDLVRNAILGPELINDKKKNAHVMNDYKQKQEKFKEERENFSKLRTNQPYKQILKNIDHTKKIEKKEDLVVHKVVHEIDADRKKFDAKFDEIGKDRTDHDQENKVIYSQNKFTEHFKKFEYAQVYSYQGKTADKNQVDLKKNRVAYYKKQQKEAEKEKERYDGIRDSLVDLGIDVENKEEDEEIKLEPLKEMDSPEEETKEVTKEVITEGDSVENRKVIVV